MKRKLKIAFVDFWHDLNKKENLIWDLLSRKYDPELSDEPDILFYSYFEKEFRNYNCVRVLFQGENIRPNFRECDFAFSFDYLPDNPRNYRLPLYVLYDDVKKLTLPKDPEKIASEKRKFCAFVVSNKLSEKRLEFFKKLSKYKKVDSGGRVFNNIGGPVSNKRDFIKDYKFTIAFENSSYPGYTTEKIFEPMLMHSVPIYWGNPLVYKDFNTKSFLNRHEFESDEELIEKIIEIDTDHDKYMEILSQPYFTDNKVNEFVDEENIMRQLDLIVDSLGKIEPVAVKYKPESKARKYLRLKIKYYRLKIKHLWFSIKYSFI